MTETAMTINFPALGETPVYVEHYLPSTIVLQDGTTRPYGTMVNGTVFVSPATFAQLETGNLDLVVQDLGTISLEPSSFDLNYSDTKTHLAPDGTGYVVTAGQSLTASIRTRSATDPSRSIPNN